MRRVLSAIFHDPFLILLTRFWINAYVFAWGDHISMATAMAISAWMNVNNDEQNNGCVDELVLCVLCYK